jgi:hypothetical protein
MKEQGPQQDFLFGKINYKILLIGIGVMHSVYFDVWRMTILMFIAMLFLILEEFVSLNNRFGFGITVYILKNQKKV